MTKAERIEELATLKEQLAHLESQCTQLSMSVSNIYHKVSESLVKARGNIKA